MGTATAVVQQAYEAFGRGDIPAILNLVADSVDWEFVGSTNLPYAGRRRNREEVADFFAAIPRADDIHAFERSTHNNFGKGESEIRIRSRLTL